MEIKTCTPTMGRLRFAGSTLCLSVTGRPVSGSIWGLDCTMKPHKLRPHGLIRILAPSGASHRPTGSVDPVSQLATKHAAARIADHNECINAPSNKNRAVVANARYGRRLLRRRHAVNGCVVTGSPRAISDINVTRQFGDDNTEIPRHRRKCATTLGGLERLPFGLTISGRCRLALIACRASSLDCNCCR